jgi:hypothetical protein
LSLADDGEVAPEDHGYFAKLLIIIEVGPTMFSLMRLRCHRFIFFLLTIQISFALHQIVPTRVMDLTPLLGIGGAPERPLFLLAGLFLAPMIGSVDLAVFLLLLLPRVSRNRARASEASIHSSGIASRSTTIFGFFMVISSTVLMSETPSQKALMISMC